LIHRQPNTEYVLSLSYGKDSIACLEAIKLLGYPLDRIVHAEVWATDTIPADLPPMVEFKREADQMILDRYGIRVEHCCAMMAVEREREREREQHTSDVSMPLTHTNQTDTYNTQSEMECMDSQLQSVRGVTVGLKLKPSEQLRGRMTYERLFYQTKRRTLTIYGFPYSMTRGAGMGWCHRLKMESVNFVSAPRTRGKEKILCSISE